MQDVRRAGVRVGGVGLAERGALAHAEAMLLVDHGDGEAVEAHVGLDQRVRADDQRQLAAGELAERVAPPRRGGRAGEQRGGDGLAAEQALDRGEVLFGERLGRRHQRGLASIADGLQHRVQRDDGLAAADLSHQQPLHRGGLAQVEGDRLDRRQLVAGRRERQRLAQPAPRERVSVAVSEHVRAGALAALGAAAQEHHLRQQQLLEGQAPTADLEVGGQLREVHRGERARAVWEPVADAGGGGQRLDDVAERPAAGAHERQDLGGGDALRGRIVRDGIALDRVLGAGDSAGANAAERAGCGTGAGCISGERVVGDAEAAARVGLAVQQQARAGRVALDQPRLVEERRAHRGAGVEHLGFDERAHSTAAHGARGDAAHLHGYGGLLAGA